MPVSNATGGAHVHDESIVADLSVKLAVPHDEVAEVYRHEIESLASQARVYAFVPILAARKTREALREQR